MKHCGRLDCACSAKRLSSFPRSCVRVLTAVIWRRSMELCLVVLLPRYIRGIRFCDFGVSGARACRGESVVVGRKPDNVHDVWYSRLSTSKHSNTPCLHHIDVVFIGQLKLVNSFSNLALLQLLTLGVHARELQYLFWSVCLSVRVFSLFWHLAQSGVQTAVSATSARYGHEI